MLSNDKIIEIMQYCHPDYVFESEDIYLDDHYLDFHHEDKDFEHIIVQLVDYENYIQYNIYQGYEADDCIGNIKKLIFDKEMKEIIKGDK